MEKQDFKIGDKVRVRRNLKGRSYVDCWLVEPMCDYEGKNTKIIKKFDNGYQLKDCSVWHFSSEMLEKIDKKQETRFKVGDRAILRRETECTIGFKAGDIVKIVDLSPYEKYGVTIENDHFRGCVDIADLIPVKRKHFKALSDNFTGNIKIENGFIVEKEEKEEILDDVERKYLSSVIKPFRNRVKSITKVGHYTGRAFIMINLNNDYLSFPNFEEKAMYKGMETFRSYTLEELGL